MNAGLFILVIVVFVAVAALALLILVIVGIHGEERRLSLSGKPRTRAGHIARRVLNMHVNDREPLWFAGQVAHDLEFGPERQAVA